MQNVVLFLWSQAIVLSMTLIPSLLPWWLLCKRYVYTLIRVSRHNIITCILLLCSCIFVSNKAFWSWSWIWVTCYRYNVYREYIPWNMQTFLLCFVMVYMYYKIVLQGTGATRQHFTTPVPMKHPWMIRVNAAHASTKTDYIANTNQSESKTVSSQRSRFVGPTWGPPGADKSQVGPMLAP